AFDAATFEIWGALLSGARLIGLDRDTALSPEQFAAWLREQAITTMFMTTAWFNQVVVSVPSAFASMRQVIFGGEEGDPQRVRDVLKHGKPQRLINGYGPTESTTFASWYEVETLPAEATTVPIGYPIANTTLYLLDRLMQPVPIGAPGELYIGGDGLARGYLNRPDLTAEKFVPNPFGAPGSRLYRSGDLARYRADGAIDFVGRIDQQVKLRGFRIELGEIEAVLGQHPAVQETIVVVREDQAGDPRLVAYVVEEQRNNGTKEQENLEPRTKNLDVEPDGSRTPGGHPVLGSSLGEGLSSTLRAFVKERLPEYMLPAAIVVLERLPLTPNGKVDRRALPAPDYTQAAETFVAPRTPLETQIAGIWAEVLGIARVGVTDNFFALGGHSLLATQVITRIREACQIELPLRALFETPTVAGLAEQIAQRQPESSLLPALTLRRAEESTDLPLSFAQQRLWFLQQLDPQSTVYHTPIRVRLSGALDVDALQCSLNTIIQRHEALRTTFPLHGEQPVQAIVPEVTLLLPLDDLSALTPAERTQAIDRLTHTETQRPFDLTIAPLLRARVLRVAADEHLLLLTLHHIITDGWSMGVLLRELAALYADPAVVLPELPVQYADYALWQRQW
ncbi:MAG TPA: condensation domain-containing protein, partial [Herpetosiphonaceae bacterium]